MARVIVTAYRFRNETNLNWMFNTPAEVRSINRSRFGEIYMVVDIHRGYIVKMYMIFVYCLAVIMFGWAHFIHGYKVCYPIADQSLNEFNYLVWCWCCCCKRVWCFDYGVLNSILLRGCSIICLEFKLNEYQLFNELFPSTRPQQILSIQMRKFLLASSLAIMHVLWLICVHLFFHNYSWFIKFY